MIKKTICAETREPEPIFQPYQNQSALEIVQTINNQRIGGAWSTASTSAAAIVRKLPARPAHTQVGAAK